MIWSTNFVAETVISNPIPLSNGVFIFSPGAAGCALPQTRMTGRPSGSGRAAAVAPPSGCTSRACSAGWTRSSVATARRAWPARSATPSTSSSSPNSVGSPWLPNPLTSLPRTKLHSPPKVIRIRLSLSWRHVERVKPWDYIKRCLIGYSNLQVCINNWVARCRAFSQFKIYLNNSSATSFVWNIIK